MTEAKNKCFGILWFGGGFGQVREPAVIRHLHVDLVVGPIDAVPSVDNALPERREVNWDRAIDHEMIMPSTASTFLRDSKACNPLSSSSLVGIVETAVQAVEKVCNRTGQGLVAEPLAIVIGLPDRERHGHFLIPKPVRPSKPAVKLLAVSLKFYRRRKSNSCCDK